MKKIYVGIDLGGTNIGIGLVDEDGNLLIKGSKPTPTAKDVSITIETMVQLVDELLEKYSCSRKDIVKIGLGVPGTANKETGMIEDANNLGFENVDMIEALKEIYGAISIRFGNDANAAAWGEYLYGAGRGTKSMIAVTLGTGIGGGIIINGALYEGINYAAGELGHFTIDHNGHQCNCGRKGCFENYASATALIQQTKEAMDQDRNSILWGLCEEELNKVEGRTLFEALAKNDATAIKVFEQYIEYLSIGITDIINIFQPEVLCIGGGISQVGDILIHPLINKVETMNYAKNSKNKTKIITASLGNDAGIIGAAMLV